MDKFLKKEERAILLLRKLYQSYGYLPYKMSRFEEYDLYVRNKDFLVSDQVITFSDHRGKLLALKPDVTLSIIKNTGSGDKGVQRMYYNENVYRVDPQTRAFREIMQTGLECVGSLSGADVAEVVLLAAQSLETLGREFVLDLSHMGLVGGMIRKSGLSHEGQQKALMYLHQKNSHELRRLCEEENCPAEALLTLVQSSGTPFTVFERIRKQVNPDLSESLLQLQQICGVLEDFGFGDRIRVDFSVGTDLKYYSGVVFKGYLEGIPAGILSGGQYDKLLQKMGRSGNAVGFAIYLNLLEQIRQAEAFDVDAVLLYPETLDAGQVIKAAAALRREYNVLTATSLPEALRWQRLYELREGEAILIEDNG